MRVLLDTCVISELRRKEPDSGVRTQVEAIRNEDLFLSVLTLGELAKGISLLEAGPRRDSLLHWLLTLEQSYAERILPVDTETARIWGELTAAAQAHGRIVAAVDGLIAATAIRHGLHVMTRNIPDFEPTGAMLVNPWGGS